MIIFRYLVTEVLKVTLAILGILLLVFISQQFVRFLGDFASGEIGGTMVLQLLLLQVPYIFSFLFPLAWFLAVLLALGRLYVDSEITVLRACGIGQKQLALYGLLPSFALSLFTALLTLFLAPWATEKQYELFDERSASSDLLLIQPGKFHPSSDGSRMFFIHDVKEGELGEVFVAHMMRRERGEGDANQKELNITLAKSGSVAAATDVEPATMTLNRGHHYQVTPGENNLVHDRFEQLHLRLSDEPARIKERKSKAISTSALFDEFTDKNWSEIQWRLSIPLSLPILFLLAVPLSRVKPRQGKFAKILPGITLYATYMLSLLSLRSGIEKGNIPGFVGLWWVHIMMLVVIFVLYRRSRLA